MFRKLYDFSGIAVAISSDEQLSESERLRRFERSGGEADFEISLEFVRDLPELEELDGETVRRCRRSLEGTPYAYAEHSGKSGRLIALEEYKDCTCAEDVLHFMDFNHILLENSAAVLHASCISTPEGAILFSAPCGTGKSTQAELWQEHRGAQIINGDRCLIRATDEGFTAGGIYYSGTSEFCENITRPLRAVVLLEQARENSVCSLRGMDSFMKIIRQCAYTNDIPSDPLRAVELITRLVRNVPVLRLACLPDKSAVEALEEALRKDEYGSTIC